LVENKLIDPKKIMLLNMMDYVLNQK